MRHVVAIVAVLILAALGGLGYVLCRPAPRLPDGVISAIGPSDADLAAVRQVVARAPQDPRAQIRLGSMLLARGQPPAAQDAFLVAARSASTAAAASDGLKRVSKQTRDWVTDLRGFRDALRQAPTNPRVWANYLEALCRAGAVPDAEAALSEARKRFRDPRAFQLQEALLLSEQGRNRRAAQLYEAGLQREPDPTAQLEFALLLARMGGRERARRAFRKAIELDPSNLVAYVGLAKISLELSRLDEAEDAAFTGLKLAPGNHEAMYVLARTLLDRGGAEDLKTGRELMDAVISQEPGHLDARYCRALIDLRLNQPRMAISDLEEILLQSPQRLDARQSYVRALQGAGESTKAEAQQRIVAQLTTVEARRSELTSRVDRRPTNVAARCDLAAFYLESGAVPAALREYERALQLDPQNQRARGGLEKARRAAR
jgi:tetratricopeptide (TPR) repeat protein